MLFTFFPEATKERVMCPQRRAHAWILGALAGEKKSGVDDDVCG
jgi:hypothetical protein